MKIAASQVGLDSSRTYRETQVVEERLEVQLRQPAQLTLQLDQVDLSPEALADLRQSRPSSVSVGRVEDRQEMQARLVETLLSALTGRRVRIVRLDEQSLQDAERSRQEAPSAAEVQGLAGSIRGFALRYDYRAVRMEQEQLHLGFNGRVTIANGEEISFSLQLDMVRSSYQEESFSLQVGQMVDPLVLSFGAANASLTGERFAFDLTADGVTEQVPLLGPGSGFLVLDRNGDGVINDGSELFGTQSGDGFADLAHYDADGNHWIDESDPVFSQLQVWANDGIKQRLLSLAELGVGALYLGSVTAQFSLQDAAGGLLGQQRRAGLFLREDRTAGLLQHIDLAI